MSNSLPLLMAAHGPVLNCAGFHDIILIVGVIAKMDFDISQFIYHWSYFWFMIASNLSRHLVQHVNFHQFSDGFFQVLSGLASPRRTKRSRRTANGTASTVGSSFRSLQRVGMPSGRGRHDGFIPGNPPVVGFPGSRDGQSWSWESPLNCPRFMWANHVKKN